MNKLHPSFVQDLNKLIILVFQRRSQGFLKEEDALFLSINCFFFKLDNFDGLIKWVPPHRKRDFFETLAKNNKQKPTFSLNPIRWKSLCQ